MFSKVLSLPMATNLKNETVLDIFCKIFYLFCVDILDWVEGCVRSDCSAKVAKTKFASKVLSLSILNTIGLLWEYNNSMLCNIHAMRKFNSYLL